LPFAAAAPRRINVVITFWLGITLLAIVLLGWLPGLTLPLDLPPPPLKAHHWLILGVLPTNLWHNLLLTVFGIWAISARSAYRRSRRFSQIALVVFAGLAVVGLIPEARAAIDWLPMHNYVVGLHVAIAAVSAVSAFVKPAPFDVLDWQPDLQLPPHQR
jgi:hypothetical protein